MVVLLKRNKWPEKVILNTAKAMSILPLNTRYNKSYGFLHFLSNWIILGFSFHQKSPYYASLPATLSFTEICADVSLSIITTYAILILNFANGSEALKFIKICSDRVQLEPKSSCTYTREYVLINLLFAVYKLLNLYSLYESQPFSTFLFQVYQVWPSYASIVVFTLLRYYALIMKWKFVELNERLQMLKYPEINTVLISKHLSDFRIVSKNHTEFVGLIDEYNTVFGWQIVIFYINIILNLLLPLNILSYYSSVSDSPMPFYQLCLLCAILTAVPLVLAYTLFRSCNDCIDECNKAQMICYDIAHALPDFDINDVFKLELRQFAHQLGQENSHFSAAGFFDVNYQLLTSLISTVTTYLIVLIQFNK